MAPRPVDDCSRLAATSLLAVSLLTPVVPAAAQVKSSRDTLEAAVQAARAHLHTRPDEFGRAVAAMVRVDRDRAVDLLRERLRAPGRNRTPGSEFEYYAVLTPYGELAQVDFERAAGLALEFPDRLLPSLSGPFLHFWRAHPNSAVDWARRFKERAPRQAVKMLTEAIRSDYDVPPDPLLDLLPAGTERSRLAAGVALRRLSRNRNDLPASLFHMASETPAGRAELDEQLYSYGTSQYPGAPNTPIQQPKISDWMAVVARLRALPGETALLGLVVNARRYGGGNDAALGIARAIRNPELRAVALSEQILCVQTQDPAQANRERLALAREAEPLMSSVHRPRLRALAAENLARALPDAQASRWLLAAIETVRTAREGQFRMFGNSIQQGTREWLLAGLLGELAPHDPLLARNRTRSLRAQLPSTYRTVILHCAAQQSTLSVALGWLRTDLHADRRNLGDYAVLAAQLHPRNAAQVAQQLPRGQERDLVLIRTVPALALPSPEAACTLAPLFASPAARSAAYESAVSAASSLALSVRLRLAREIPNPLIRAQATGPAVVEALQDREIPPAVARVTLAELAPCGPKWEAMKELVDSLPPDDALPYARSIERYTERIQALRNVLDRVARKDPARALAEATAETNPEARADLTSSVAVDLVKEHPEMAERLARQIEHRPSREAIQVELIRRTLDRDLDQALAAAREIVIRGNRNSLYPELLGRALMTRKTPEQVWPLIAWASRDPWTTVGRWAERERRDHSPYPPIHRYNEYHYDAMGTLRDAVTEWTRHFPTEAWTAPLGTPATSGENSLDPSFLGAFSAHLAEAHPDEAIRVLDRARAGEQPWRTLLIALSSAHPERVSPLFARLHDPMTRMELAAQFTTAPPVVADRSAWRERVTQAATEALQALPGPKDPSTRTTTLLQIAEALQRAGLPAAEPIRLARQTAAGVKDLYFRAGLLEQIERAEKRGIR